MNRDLRAQSIARYTVRIIRQMFVLLLSCGVACVVPDTKDISASPEYKHVVGAKFRTLQELIAYGVTTDANYARRVDFITLWAPPGFSGPEVVTVDSLPRNSTLQVVGVARYPRPWPSEVHYIVRVMDERAPTFTAPIRVQKKGSATDRNLGLDSALFRRIEKQDSTLRSTSR